MGLAAEFPGRPSLAFPRQTGQVLSLTGAVTKEPPDQNCPLNGVAERARPPTCRRLPPSAQNTLCHSCERRVARIPSAARAPTPPLSGPLPHRFPESRRAELCLAAHCEPRGGWDSLVLRAVDPSGWALHWHVPGVKEVRTTLEACHTPFLRAAFPTEDPAEAGVGAPREGGESACSFRVRGGWWGYMSWSRVATAPWGAQIWPWRHLGYRISHSRLCCHCKVGPSSTAAELPPPQYTASLP